jgi:hypothetical protein
MGMAKVPCGGCGHSWDDHEKVDFGPTRCKVEGCDCCQGPAQRDDLVDVIMDMKTFIYEIRRRSDLTDVLEKILVSFIASLEERLRNLE